MVNFLVWMDDGRPRPCVMKRACHREADVYRLVLTPPDGPALLGTAPADGGVWLFLEALPGNHPDFGLEAEVVQAYAALGALHQRYAGKELPIGSGNWGPTGDEVWSTLRRVGVPPRPVTEAAHLLTGGTRTLIHGDFHRWNLLWDRGQVVMLDWEHAAYSHPVWDLVLLAPEEPARDDLPAGDLAWTALGAYHAAGLLAPLPWEAFVRLQISARLFISARRLLHHRARAVSAADPAAAGVILEHAEQEQKRITYLLGRLG